MRYDREYRGTIATHLRGKRCRVVTTWRRRAPHNVRMEFEDGTPSVICPLRCIRQVAT